MRELGGRAEALAGTMQRKLPAAVRGGGEGEWQLQRVDRLRRPRMSRA